MKQRKWDETRSTAARRYRNAARWRERASLLPLQRKADFVTNFKHSYNPFSVLTEDEGRQKLSDWANAYEELPTDGIVYHYTSAAALGGILSSKSMFCSDYRLLNDTTELGLGLEVLEAAVASRGAEQGLIGPAQTEILNRLANLKRASFHLSMFCASFSLNRRDLTQWRAYAPNNGVCIGFYGPQLKAIAENQAFVCGPVRYLGAPYFYEWLDEQLCAARDGWIEMAENEKKMRMECRANGLTDDATDLHAEMSRCGNIDRWVAEVSSLLKNADFRAEHEWRCSYVLRENTVQHRLPVSFRPSGANLVRYVELDFSSVQLSELIASIDLGPGNASDKAFSTVESLCQAAELRAEITGRSHAYRPTF